MDINKISIEEFKNNPKKYAKKYTTDELLDALNLCKENNERKQAIIEILKIQRKIEQQINDEWLNNKESDDSELNLSTLLDKFHTNIDAYSLKHRLIEIWAKNPELSFKCGLLKCCTLLLEGTPLSEQENDVFEEFNINTADFALLNKLKVELELDLKSFYSTEDDNFIDITYNKQIQDSLHLLQEVANKISVMKHANGRLEGKKPIPWHCALDDSPEGLKLFGEDLVEYNLWDEYIPYENHVSSLELINRINTSSVNDLEKMYIKKSQDDDLRYWKIFYKGDKERYIIFLKEMLLIEFVDILNMYRSGDRFMVVKATYKDKEISDGKYINCRYVDIYSEKTKKIYRALSN